MLKRYDTRKPLKYVQLYVKIYQTKCYLLSYSTYSFQTNLNQSIDNVISMIVVFEEI